MAFTPVRCAGVLVLVLLFALVATAVSAPSQSAAGTIGIATRRTSIHERVLKEIVLGPGHPYYTDAPASPPAVAAAAHGVQGVVEGTVLQPLDHFDARSAATWEMRYWVDSRACKPSKTTNGTTVNSRVFLSMGGEGAQGPPGGQMAQMAEASLADGSGGALLVSIEHRYFGSSIPTADFSTGSLRYLGTEQALADAAYFQQWFSRQRNLTKDTRWFTFGGSYSGELAAFARIKCAMTHCNFALLFQNGVTQSGSDECLSPSTFKSRSNGTVLARCWVKNTSSNPEFQILYCTLYHSKKV